MGIKDKPRENLSAEERRLKELGIGKDEEELSEEEKRIQEFQMENSDHSPDYSYVHKEGKIAGVSQEKPMTFFEADGGKANPYYGKKFEVDGKEYDLSGYDTNCQTCVVAYEARRRGYNVRALPNLGNKYIKQLSKEPSLAYIGKDGVSPVYLKKSENERLIDFLEREVKKGARYVLKFYWDDAPYGHIISVERGRTFGNDVQLYDPQTGENDTIISYYSMRASNFQLMRVDNLEFNYEYVDYILKGEKE